MDCHQTLHIMLVLQKLKALHKIKMHHNNQKA